MFVVAYTEQREMLFGKAMTAAFRMGEEQYLNDVTSGLKNFETLTCSASITKRSQKPCEDTKAVLIEVKAGLSSEQAKALNTRFKNVAKQYNGLFRYEQIQEIPNFFMPQAVVQVAMDSWINYLDQMPSVSEKKNSEGANMLFGMGQMVIWPFMLALALALRITKVTIDAFEWAK